MSRCSPKDDGLPRTHFPLLKSKNTEPHLLSQSYLLRRASFYQPEPGVFLFMCHRPTHRRRHYCQVEEGICSFLRHHPFLSTQEQSISDLSSSISSPVLLIRPFPLGSGLSLHHQQPLLALIRWNSAKTGRRFPSQMQLFFWFLLSRNLASKLKTRVFADSCSAKRDRVWCESQGNSSKATAELFTGYLLKQRLTRFCSPIEIEVSVDQCSDLIDSWFGRKYTTYMRPWSYPYLQHPQSPPHLVHLHLLSQIYTSPNPLLLSLFIPSIQHLYPSVSRCFPLNSVFRLRIPPFFTPLSFFLISSQTLSFFWSCYSSIVAALRHHVPLLPLPEGGPNGVELQKIF